VSLWTFAVRRPDATEHRRTFACFGGECTVIVADAARPADAAAAAAMGERALLTWHERFSRFARESELSRLNRSTADEVAASPLMRRIVDVALAGARDTGGLVDITLADEIEHAGYDGHMEGPGADLIAALARAPSRATAAAHLDERWRRIAVDERRGTIIRPPGLRLDLGGVAKGVFADVLAEMLQGFDAYAVDCCGDLRVGGRARSGRPVNVASPFDGSTLHTFRVTEGSVATSGIGRRSWTTDGGCPAHHLLNPRTGAPAFTGIVQASALAPTAAQAEVLAKAAVLSGPARAAEWLGHGGVIVLDDGRHQVVGPEGSAETGAAQPMTGGAQTMTGGAQTMTAGRPGSLRISWKRSA
jgi:thiamine biosynthesis lipoprotein